MKRFFYVSSFVLMLLGTFSIETKPLCALIGLALAAGCVFTAEQIMR